mmetsp:Transcript_26826/g.75282  ORF Transcript_26826/g.75282 Transcript_26826/m.75282 type:complete len:849 (+) Transcript_26826:103-2649(+)
MRTETMILPALQVAAILLAALAAAAAADDDGNEHGVLLPSVALPQEALVLDQSHQMEVADGNSNVDDDDDSEHDHIMHFQRRSFSSSASTSPRQQHQQQQRQSLLRRRRQESLGSTTAAGGGRGEDGKPGRSEQRDRTTLPPSPEIYHSEDELDCAWFYMHGHFDVVGCESGEEFPHSNETEGVVDPGDDTNSTEDGGSDDDVGDTITIDNDNNAKRPPPLVYVIHSIALDESPQEFEDYMKRRLVALSTDVVTDLIDQRTPFQSQQRRTSPTDPGGRRRRLIHRHHHRRRRLSDDQFNAATKQDPMAFLLHSITVLNPMDGDGPEDDAVERPPTFLNPDFLIPTDPPTVFNPEFTVEVELPPPPRETPSMSPTEEPRFTIGIPPPQYNTDDAPSQSPTKEPMFTIGIPPPPPNDDAAESKIASPQLGTAHTPAGDSEAAGTSNNDDNWDVHWYHIEIAYEAYWPDGPRIMHPYVLGNISHVCQHVLNDAIRQEYYFEKMRQGYILKDYETSTSDDNEFSFPILAASVYGKEDEFDWSLIQKPKTSSTTTTSSSSDVASNDDDNDTNENNNPTFPNHLNRHKWKLREWFGVLLLLFTMMTTLGLSYIAHQMKQQKQKEEWKVYLTENGIEDILEYGWDYRRQQGNDSQDQQQNTLQRGNTQQMVLNIYNKSNIGYNDENSLLQGPTTRNAGAAMEELYAMENEIILSKKKQSKGTAIQDVHNNDENDDKMKTNKDDDKMKLIEKLEDDDDKELQCAIEQSLDANGPQQMIDPDDDDDDDMNDDNDDNVTMKNDDNGDNDEESPIETMATAVPLSIENESPPPLMATVLLDDDNGNDNDNGNRNEETQD